MRLLGGAASRSSSVSSPLYFAAVFALSSSSPSSSLAYSTTRRRPYKCVPPTPSSALRASCLVVYSTNAKPRWLPSNFLGSLHDRRCPNGANSAAMSLRVASNATLRTTSLEDTSLLPPLPFSLSPALPDAAAAPLAGAALRLDSCSDSLWLSSMEPCSAWITAAATSGVDTSTKPNPADSTSPPGPLRRVTRALCRLPPAADTARSKWRRSATSVVANEMFLT
mmetsp:Transcript_35946/g.90780  ORF Transcript_35946/g.90780 Transcript_35946/m.90780 type:complete len:224 (-) Transcript_35946:140-811(-)